jgi:hypothetical protein
MSVHCSYLELVACLTEENKRRKRKNEGTLYRVSFRGLAYLSSQRMPRNLGCFSDNECRHNYRKDLLKEMYDGSEVTCYDKLRLTKKTSMTYASCCKRDLVFVIVYISIWKKRLLCSC